MERKLFLISIFLVTFASAKGFDYLLESFAYGRNAANPCSTNDGQRFAKNTRGCSWFFVCEDNEVLQENRCPSDFYFSEERQLCDKRENVECTIPDPPTKCPSERGINVIPHPYSCSRFTVCFDGFLNDRTCPPGLHFSYYDGTCVDPFTADCNVDYKVCEETVGSIVPVFVPDSRDCRSYYMCLDGRSIPLQCAPNSHFDPTKNWCVDTEVAECTPSIPDEQPNIPDKISIECEGNSGINFPHPESCEFFFFCAGDRSYLQICGAGLIFDVNTSRCQVSENAVCVLEIPPSEPEPEPEPENPDPEPENPDPEPENPDPEPENPDPEPENP